MHSHNSWRQWEIVSQAKFWFINFDFDFDFAREQRRTFPPDHDKPQRSRSATSLKKPWYRCSTESNSPFYMISSRRQIDRQSFAPIGSYTMRRVSKVAGSEEKYQLDGIQFSVKHLRYSTLICQWCEMFSIGASPLWPWWLALDTDHSWAPPGCQLLASQLSNFSRNLRVLSCGCREYLQGSV